jgi:Cd2+/Zn2+-exporting ATPase
LTQPVASVALDAVLQVRPGERVPMDGVLTAGSTSINQAPVTGESIPVDKAVGDPVFAGTINDTGSFEFRVTALASNSTLARIIHAVETAQASRAPTQRWVDQFARVYTPAVFAFALAVAVLPPMFFSATWTDAVYRALVLLVIACPCALVISTPVTIVSALTSAARKGILIKGGAYLESGRKLAWLALDKTGTLTYGRPVLTDYEPKHDMPEAQARQIATSLAARSDHPVSRAVAESGASMGVALIEVNDVTALAGRGVQGVLKGVVYRLGNHRLIEEMHVCSPDLEARLQVLERQGKTTLMLTDGKAVLALLAVADTVRGTSREAIAALHAVGVKTLVLTGDNEHTAKTIADAVGIDEVAANQLPEDKAEQITAKRLKGGLVGMVGDGINDAPALAKADIGFAMGAAGSDIAIETADVALMDDDLRKVARFVTLSRATHQVLVQNIVLALGIKAVFLVLTLMGSATMWMAVFADMGTSLLVVANGLRLLQR